MRKRQAYRRLIDFDFFKIKGQICAGLPKSSEDKEVYSVYFSDCRNGRRVHFNITTVFKLRLEKAHVEIVDAPKAKFDFVVCATRVIAPNA